VAAARAKAAQRRRAIRGANLGALRLKAGSTNIAKSLVEIVAAIEVNTVVNVQIEGATVEGIEDVVVIEDLEAAVSEVEIAAATVAAEAGASEAETAAATEEESAVAAEIAREKARLLRFKPR
jgi:pyruvate/oxaloacetate carboxyltransferase